jgi:hypothetical protein
MSHGISSSSRSIIFELRRANIRRTGRKNYKGDKMDNKFWYEILEDLLLAGHKPAWRNGIKMECSSIEWTLIARSFQHNTEVWEYSTTIT